MLDTLVFKVSKVIGETFPGKLTAQKDGQTHGVKVGRKFTANATKEEEEEKEEKDFEEDLN